MSFIARDSLVGALCMEMTPLVPGFIFRTASGDTFMCILPAKACMPPGSDTVRVSEYESRRSSLLLHDEIIGSASANARYNIFFFMLCCCYLLFFIFRRHSCSARLASELF